jgi:hypothetical protein
MDLISQTSSTGVDIGQLLSDWGVVGLVALILVAGAKQVWVWGWTYRDKAKECEEWKSRALRAVTTATKAVDIAEQVHEEEVS